MTARRTIIGVCALCVLSIFATAAQSASAAGQTMHYCKQTGTKTGANKYAGPHCKQVSPEGVYGHVEIPNNEKQEAIFDDTNEAEEHTGAILKSTVAGSAIELVATSVSGSGTAENSEAGGEMRVTGEGKVLYSGVTEKLLGCKVTGKPGGAGAVETKQLSASTAGVGDKIKFVPKEGTIFAEFELTECIVGPITIKVVGSALGTPEGSTVKWVHNPFTEEKTLRLQSAAGPVAGFAAAKTVRVRPTPPVQYVGVGFTT